MIENWMKFYLVTDSSYNILIYNAQMYYKEWQTMLGSHLVLVHYMGG